MQELIYKFRLYGPKKFLRLLLEEVYLIARRKLLHTYSQCGEDLILDSLLSDYKKGFYVDVGAYDPIRFSNTLHFYQKGWSGISIEPNYDQYNKFVRSRPYDINLNIGVSKHNATMMYYQMNPTTLSTFSKSMADEYIRCGYVLKNKKKVPVLTLKEILKRNGSHRDIHFLTIDVEGHEMEVLKSNDWKKYRPHVICLEVHYSNMDVVTDKKRELMVLNYLDSIGYIYYTKTQLNYFFIDKKKANKITHTSSRQRTRGI